MKIYSVTKYAVKCNSVRLLLLLIVPILAPFHSLLAQQPYYFRIYLKDKGTPSRVLTPSDPSYALATAHLTLRALARRAKVLPPDSLVSTDDLPIPSAYLSAIAASGARIAQTSRWFNTVMVYTDSATYLQLLNLPFIDSIQPQRARHVVPDISFARRGAVADGGSLPSDNDPWSAPSGCITDNYGFAGTQNRQIGVDEAHRLGIAGEGVLVGVLDAGFHWRDHLALRNLHVVGEHDYVYNDDTTSDQPGEDPSEYHGSMVTSMIGGYWQGHLVGGAPHASFIFAKTEDTRSERHIEEDNFVAGLEWFESQGVDVTNTSLGYTTFDPTEQVPGYSYDQLNGHTAFASRGVNHAVHLGLVCVLAAGNENIGFHYVSVPAEADSAIAVAAVDSNGLVTNFSSRGFADHQRLKPDVAAPGAKVWGANPAGDSLISFGPGTSFASPMVTATVALILSAAPELTPFEVRTLLYRSSSRASHPDTTYGYGVVNAGRALHELSLTRPIVGFPKVSMHDGLLSVIAATEYNGPGIASSQLDTSRWLDYLSLQISRPGTEPGIEINRRQPAVGLARWLAPSATTALGLKAGDSVDIRIYSTLGQRRLLRRATLVLEDGLARPVSFLCSEPPLAYTGISDVVPNPFSGQASIQFFLDASSDVRLAVYNSLGQQVALLLDEKGLPNGFHAIPFDPSGMAAGSYYYKLDIDGKSYSQRMNYLP